MKTLWTVERVVGGGLKSIDVFMTRAGARQFAVWKRKLDRFSDYHTRKYVEVR